MGLSEEVKIKIFDELIRNLKHEKQLIIEENKKDLEEAKKNMLPGAMVDRLNLDEKSIQQMIDGVEQIKNQPQIVNTFYNEFENEIGLKVKRQRVPLGVILMIFESRPNVIVDCAALAIKSSNAIILKGGKEAKFSNKVLGDIVRKSVEKFVDPNAINVLDSSDRNSVNELLSLNEYIDVVIPRGGHGLIEYVHRKASMPVIAHYKGLCHMYIDEFADIDKAVNLVENAKTQRTGVCNAIETLLIHRETLPKIAKKIVERLEEKGTELRVDDYFSFYSDKSHVIAKNDDWNSEYLDNILSIKTVSDMNEAIEHISTYGSHHSECIVSENQSNCNSFLSRVDASCVLINASTRFNDGGQLGLGAELGISTSKIHAYGPMGAEQMTTTRFVVVGDGHLRS